MAKKPSKTAKKPAPKKAVKKVVKKAAPKAKKPVAKKVAPKKASKPAAKKPIAKKQSKPASKAKKVIVKKVVAKKPAPKKVVAKKVIAKPASVKHVDHKSNAPKAEVKRHATNLVAQPRAHKNDDHRTRYSDKELLEFKNLIDEKMEAAKGELKYLNDQINRKDDNGTDDTENKFGSIEDGSVAMEREYMSQMATRQSTYIDHLEKALMRIESKTYGICRVTGKLIDKERLRAVPHATLSIEAKMMQGK